MEKFMRAAGVVVCAAVLAVAGVGCNNSQYTEKVVGIWDWPVGGGMVVVTVNKDGTGSLQGPVIQKTITWRIQRGNNFVFNDGSKDSGFLIDSADENTIRGSDPQAPGQPIVWTRRK